MAAKSKAPTQAQKVSIPKRGEIYLVNFDPTVGAEIKKTRPALVIQNNIANQYSPITIVAAITSQCNVPPYPTEVLMQTSESGLQKTPAVMLSQIRSMDRVRLLKKIGGADRETMRRVDQALKISLGLVLIQ